MVWVWNNDTDLGGVLASTDTAFIFEREQPAARSVEVDAGLGWDVGMIVLRDVLVV